MKIRAAAAAGPQSTGDDRFFGADDASAALQAMTLAAAISRESGRRHCGVDLDPEYLATAQRRLEQAAMNWLAEYRKTGGAGTWLACGRASASVKAAKANARKVFERLKGGGGASGWEFRVGTTRGDIYQVCINPTWWKLQWSLAEGLPAESTWRGEYRAPDEEWLKVGDGGALEHAVLDCQDWHSHSVHSGGVFRVVQSDARGSIWLESSPPHQSGLIWRLAS